MENTTIRKFIETLQELDPDKKIILTKSDNGESYHIAFGQFYEMDYSDTIDIEMIKIIIT
jgi:hypothetical protein